MTLSKYLGAGFALLVLGTYGNAQQVGQQVRQVKGVKHISYDMATGEMTPGQDSSKAVGLAPTFSNTDSSGFFGIGNLSSAMNGGPGGPEVWLDWGIAPVDTGSEIVGEFDFAYATTVTALNGVDLVLGFYDGAVGFCADTGLGSAAATFAFSGLPGVTTTTSGAITNAYIVSVSLQGGFEFCSAGAGLPFGFSFESLDDSGIGVWGSGPILCFAGNQFGGPDSNGQVDVFDIYDTAVGAGNVCVGSFFFGGPPSDFSSWFLEIRTAAPDPGGADDASVQQSNGTGINPNTFVVSSPPVLGEVMVASDSSSGGLGVFLVGYLSPLVFNLPPFGEILVNIADPSGELLGSLSGPYIYVGGTASIVIPIPTDLTLSGLTVFTQTVEFGCVVLHNSNRIVLGF